MAILTVANFLKCNDVNDPRHAQLMADIGDVLESCDFETHEMTYHSRLPPETVHRLRLLDTNTALAIRNRADRFALHRSLPICFEYDGKTRNPRTRAENCAVDAIQLAHHILKARLGVQILYCYRDIGLDIDVGFWCHALPRISCVMMTERGESIAGLAGYLRGVYHDVQFAYTPSTNGSGMPFVLIDRAVIQELPSWRMEIAALVTASSADAAAEA